MIPKLTALLEYRLNLRDPKEDGVLDRLCEVLAKFGPAAAGAAPLVIRRLKAKNEWSRQGAVTALAAIGGHSLEAKAALTETALREESEEVRLAAARAALELFVEPAEDGDAILAAIVTDGYVVNSIYQELDGIADKMRPGPESRRDKARPRPRVKLSTLPWPPPRYSAIGKFGLDFPRNLLGDDQATLDNVYHRLYAALKAADHNFEARVFGVPGGFALVTSVERTEQDGTPLPSRYRFAEGAVPPYSLADYITKLFTDPPSNYRQLAFVVTDQANFGTSDQPLPDISTAGGDTLPDEIADQKLRDKTAYVLIYARGRRTGEAGYTVRGISAATHLAESGVLKALQN